MMPGVSPSVGRGSGYTQHGIVFLYAVARLREGGCGHGERCESAAGQMMRMFRLPPTAVSGMLTATVLRGAGRDRRSALAGRAAAARSPRCIRAPGPRAVSVNKCRLDVIVRTSSSRAPLTRARSATSASSGDGRQCDDHANLATRRVAHGRRAAARTRRRRTDSRSTNAADSRQLHSPLRPRTSEAHLHGHSGVPSLAAVEHAVPLDVARAGPRIRACRALRYRASGRTHRRVPFRQRRCQGSPRRDRCRCGSSLGRREPPIAPPT